MQKWSQICGEILVLKLSSWLLYLVTNQVASQDWYIQDILVNPTEQTTARDIWASEAVWWMQVQKTN